jgi:hypothetical protein
MFIATRVDAREHDPNHKLHASATHDIVIEAVSWISFPITCATGDTLFGEFRIVSNGNLFPGDETKYDNWLLEGVDFLILDEDNYNLWIEDSTVTPTFEQKSLFESTWSIEIPHEGIWYVIYSNDSIFLKKIEGSIVRTGPYDMFIPLIGLIGVASILILILIFKKKE